jgi:hypothetical protein
MVQEGRLISPPPQVLKCGNLDSRFQAVDDATTPKSGGFLEPEEPRPPLRNFPMTHKTRLLLLLVVWVGLAPHAWAEEKAATREGPTEELRAKAEKGDAGSQYNLGLAYLNGHGIPKDIAEAVKWWRKAAEHGNAGSQHALGFAYANGHGVPKDEAEAVKWWRKAAEQGDADSQFGLGVAYDNGHGVAKDGAEAVKWYRMAAEQGDVSAQNNLSLKYARGEGVPKDDVLAYKWILLAGATREKSRETIQLIENRLTPEQRAEGQKLAREFKPVVQK